MAQAPHNGHVTTVGDEVELTDGLKGEVKYVGDLHGKQGIFYGIELKESKGKNDGSIDSRYYFKTKEKRGKFVPLSGIKSTKHGDLPRITVGDKVKVLSKGNGTVRYIGTPLFKPGVWYGVELEKPDGKNNGTVDKHQYFQCQDKHGTFVQIQSIQLTQDQQPSSKPSSAKASTKSTKSTTTATTSTKTTPAKSTTTTTSKDATENSDKSKKTKSSDDTLQVSDKVVVKPDRLGQLKWIGQAKNFGVGTWYGVRLVEQKGQCNGTYKDHKFFQCPDGYGIYVQKSLIVKKLDANDPKANFDFMDEEKKYEQEKEQQSQQLKEEKDKLRLVKQKFQEIDSDGNRSVDVDEWLKLTKDIFPELSEEESRVLFREIDISDSKEVSFAEFDAWVTKIGGIEKIMTKKGNTSSTDEKTDPSNDEKTDQTNNTETQPSDSTNVTSDTTNTTSDNANTTSDNANTTSDNAIAASSNENPENNSNAEASIEEQETNIASKDQDLPSDSNNDIPNDT